MTEIEITVYYKNPEGNNAKQTFVKEFKDPDEGINRILNTGFKFFSKSLQSYVIIPVHKITQITYKLL